MRVEFLKYRHNLKLKFQKGINWKRKYAPWIACLYLPVKKAVSNNCERFLIIQLETTKGSLP